MYVDAGVAFILFVVVIGIIGICKNILRKEDQGCGDYGCSHCHPTEYEEECNCKEDECRYNKEN